MYIENKKIIFLHIPKTGGSSIEMLLGKEFNISNTYLRHNTFSQIFNKMEDKSLNKYIIFTILRDPFERIVSTYNHGIRANILKQQSFQEYVNYIFKYYSNDFEKTEYNSNDYMHFNSKKVIDKRHIETLQYWINIPNFLNFNDLTLDKKNDCLVLTNNDVTIYLLRFNHLNDDFNKFKKVININKNLQHTNINPLSSSLKASINDYNKITNAKEKFLNIYSEEFNILNDKKYLNNII
jgi:hypothetical protein